MIKLPILYSFRRCPYAMRARMALYYNNINCEIREVDLKNKPDSLIQLSQKATVPVLYLPANHKNDNQVIEESLDIMYFANAQNSKLAKASPNYQKEQKLIKFNDQEFVSLLYKYKYFENYPELSQINYRQNIEEICLQQYEKILQTQNFLLGSESLADLAIFPFLRQFALVDSEWFFNSQYRHIINWLNYYLEQDYFQNIIMAKYRVWQSGDSQQYFFK